MAWAAAIPAVIQLAQSVSQNQKAKKFAKAKRPFQNYPIPEPIYENVRAARNIAGSSGLPGQGYAENKLSGATAAADYNLLQSQQSPNSVAAGINANQGRFNDAESNLLMKGAEFKNSNQRVLAGANMDLAKALDMKYRNDFEWNDKLPYLNNMAASAALKEASLRNSMNALNSLSKLGQSALENQTTKTPIDTGENGAWLNEDNQGVDDPFTPPKAWNPYDPFNNG